MLKLVVLLNIFVETVIHFHSGFLDEYKEQNLFETEIFCNIINVFTVAIDWCNTSNKVLMSLTEKNWTQTFEL